MGRGSRERSGVVPRPAPLGVSVVINGSWYNPDALLFAPIEGRSVVASFTGGAITSDAGALLLGATDRAIGLVERFAACFQDARDPGLIEHELPALVGQRVFGIALGYEDLVDHDQLRHDPVLAVLGGKL